MKAKDSSARAVLSPRQPPPSLAVAVPPSPLLAGLCGPGDVAGAQGHVLPTAHGPRALTHQALQGPPGGGHLRLRFPETPRIFLSVAFPRALNPLMMM